MREDAAAQMNPHFASQLFCEGARNAGLAYRRRLTCNRIVKGRSGVR